MEKDIRELIEQFQDSIEKLDEISRAYYKEQQDKQEIIRRLEWVKDESLDEVLNVIYDIIDEYKEAI